MRWPILSLSAVVVMLGVGLRAGAQVDPNQPQQPTLGQQLRDNMNNAGVTPQDIGQQIRDQIQQNGGQIDPQAIMQNLQTQGIINQGMIDQFNQNMGQFRDQMQQRNQQRQMSSLQQALNSPDDEWSILGPKVQRVLDIKTDLAINDVALTQQRGFGGGPGGGLGGQNLTGTAASADQSPLAKALADLQTVLQDPNSSDTEIAAKLGAFRQAREHSVADLKTARQDLMALVTLRQEALLLNMDILN